MNHNNELGDDDDNFDFDLDATDDFFNTTDDQMDSEFTAIADHYIANSNKNKSNINEPMTNINSSNNADFSVGNDNDNEEHRQHKFARVEEFPSHTESNIQLHSTVGASSQDHLHEYNKNINNNVNENRRTVEEDMDVEATFDTHEHEFHDDDMDFHDLPHDGVFSTQSNPPYFNTSTITGSSNPLQKQQQQQGNNNNNNMMSENEYETEMDAPPFIENVQSFLPSVAPDAFPVIVAVLAQANINASIDLCELSCATRNVEFVPTRRAASATMRLHEPSAVILIRSSGAMSIIGSASISEARQAAELASRIIRKALNLNFDTFQFRVRSLMARFNVCSPIRLEALARYRMSEKDAIPGVGGVFGSYEPERFSGCIVRIVGNSHRNR